ncbi:MAG: FUSC family protein, partial [Alphaproteobacteria bacterium]|nr:FUSC family protein [Alphaproteobacteria bacterium]
GSLKASLDRLVGTIVGAIWGVAVAFVPHDSPWLRPAVLLVALAPLSMLVAFKPTYRIAPVTAVIVLLSSTSAVEGPFLPALYRVLEISIGSLMGLLVALLVFPARAHHLLADQSAAVLGTLAELAKQIPERLAGRGDAATWLSLSGKRRKAQEKAEALADEAKRERRTRLTESPDPEPLARTLRRLGFDMASLGRATSDAWDTCLSDRVMAPAQAVAAAMATFLTDCGQALIARRPPPPIEPLATALADYGRTVEALRHDGVTRPLPGPALERLFGLGFALDQMRLDAEDLTERIADLAPAAESLDAAGAQ